MLKRATELHILVCLQNVQIYLIQYLTPIPRSKNNIVLQLSRNNWTMHKTLYLVCCMLYWIHFLFLNAKCYGVLCISYLKRQKAVRRTITVFINWFSSNKIKYTAEKSKFINCLCEQYYFEIWLVDSNHMEIIKKIFSFRLQNYWHSHNLIAQNQYNFLKTFEKNVHSISDFYIKIIKCMLVNTIIFLPNNTLKTTAIIELL